MKNGGFGFSPVWKELVTFIEQADIADIACAAPGLFQRNKNEDGGWRIEDSKSKMEDDSRHPPSSILHSRLYVAFGRRGFGLGPIPLGRLDDEAFFDGGGGHADRAVPPTLLLLGI